VARDLAAAFEKQSGHKVRMSVASSGTLYAQIENGAPFDVFLSADVDYPRKLVSSGKGEPSGLQVYALGRLVLWSRTDMGIDCAREGQACLLDTRIRRIAIANPRHAPYGAAAIEVMQGFGWYERLQPKLVLGESLAQAMQFAESGAAEIAIVGLSMVLSPSLAGKGSYWLVPEEHHAPIEQAAVIVRSKGRDQGPARLFLKFLTSAEGTAILSRHGYTAPGQGARER
jgi:molybdate transport system substrate-binding protein